MWYKLFPLKITQIFHDTFFKMKYNLKQNKPELRWLIFVRMAILDK